MRMRRNLESLSLRLRSRCFRTATACFEIVSTFPKEQRSLYSTHLLDQHVQVLRDVWGEAWINHSVSRDRTEAELQEENISSLPRTNCILDRCTSSRSTHSKRGRTIRLENSENSVTCPYKLALSPSSHVLEYLSPYQ